MDPISLYIVEDESIIAHDLKNKLTDFGYSVIGIDADGEKAVDHISALAKSNKEPDIVIMDIKLAGKMDGIEAAKILTEKTNCGIIFLTSLNKSEVFKKSFFLKPYAYIFKPVDVDQMRTAIEVAYYQRNLELTNQSIIAELKSEIEQRKIAEKEKKSATSGKDKSGTTGQSVDETKASDGIGSHQPGTCYFFHFYFSEE